MRETHKFKWHGTFKDYFAGQVIVQRKLLIEKLRQSSKHVPLKDLHYIDVV